MWRQHGVTKRPGEGKAESAWWSQACCPLRRHELCKPPAYVPTWLPIASKPKGAGWQGGEGQGHDGTWSRCPWLQSAGRSRAAGEAGPGTAGQSSQHFTQGLPPTSCGTEVADTALHASTGSSQTCRGSFRATSSPLKASDQYQPFLSCGHRGAGPMSEQLAGEGRSFLLSMKATVWDSEEPLGSHAGHRGHPCKSQLAAEARTHQVPTGMSAA
ncbi:uncharacterized protein LOC107151811 [Marmota marmota marmota]|uniref:uncharacterized protein LOC107151811 n=1 Tax=Marmota marmota marmota TaxID=9994 RepID=UPI0007628927|nr:uncharacterized protein LOC107151811 [Marmota marmota marmota]